MSFHDADGTNRAQPFLIGINDVARILGRSEMSVRRDDAVGRIPRSVSIGRSKRWRPKEIRLWVQAGCPDRATWEARFPNRIEPPQP